MNKLTKQIYEIYKPFRVAMLTVFVFIAASQGLILASPYFSGKVIDGLVSKESLPDVLLLAGLALATGLLQVVVSSFLKGRHELKKLQFSIERHTSRFTMKKMLGFSIGQHVSENSGVKRSVINRGQNAMESLVQLMLYQVIPTCVEVALLIVVLFWFSAPLGFIVFAGTVLYVSFMFYSNRKFRGDFEYIEKKYTESNKLHGEVLRNISLVLANAQEDKAEVECDKSLAAVTDYARKTWLRFNVFAAARSAIISVVSFFVLATGIVFVFREKYTVGQLAMFLAWSGSALNRVASTGNMQRQFIQRLNSVKKYFEMISIESDVKEAEKPIRKKKFSGRIEFDGVTLSYKRRSQSELSVSGEALEGKKVGPALDNVSFTIEAGQTVAFVGESGAGKSTVLYALIRAQDPQSGKILVDGNDLKLLDIKMFRESVGIVNQNVRMFDKSLRYNMLYGRDDREDVVTIEQLNVLAEMSCIDRFVGCLEDGYDTLLGEDGVKLSGGQCQRVGIARALAKDPDILVFDEATSSLDSRNEFLIRESIARASKGRTTIIIAHRFSTIRNVDKIFVFDEGKIVGEGTHSELAHSCEAYQRLLENQLI